MMIRYWVSDEHRVNFLGVPKCGTSTVRKLLSMDPKRDWQEAPEPGYPVFAVLRHPLPRVRSGWQEARRRGQTRAETFGAFLDEVEQRGFFDEHIEPMARYVLDPDAQELVCLDRLPGWMDRRFGISAEQVFSTRENASAAVGAGLDHFGGKQWVDALTMLQRVQSLYADDFELYAKAK